VPNTDIITALESFTIVGPHSFRDIRVAILVTVIYVGSPMVLIIFACPNHSIVKSASLRVVKL